MANDAKKVIRALRRGEGDSVSSIVWRTGMSRDTVKKTLAELKGSGFVKDEGDGDSKLTQKGREKLWSM